MNVNVSRRRGSVPRTEHEGSYHSVVLSIFMCVVFPRYARKNHTPTIGMYHAAAGKKCGFEMRNNATA